MPDSSRPKILVFASGTASGGGSGFENLVRHSRESNGDLKADIVGVVSNHKNGGVALHASALSIPFFYFPVPHFPISKSQQNYSNILKNIRIEKNAEEPKPNAKTYQAIAEKSGAEWFALSGWMKRIEGLDPARTFNIHPALLSLLGGRFGGEGMYGGHVHHAVREALEKGEIQESGVSMHFVTDEYDRGPVFFEFRVPLMRGMSAEEIQEKVNKAEHQFQPKITNMVVNGDISWNGKDPATLKVPDGYRYLPRA